MTKERVIKNPESVTSLAAESETGFTSVEDKILRFSKAKKRSTGMADYIEFNAVTPGELKLGEKINDCGSFLLLRDYYQVGQVKLASANFCKNHLLCPFCAIQRAAKTTRIYVEKIEEILKNHPDAKLYFVTKTIKNREDLGEAYRHLQGSRKKEMTARRLHKSNPNRPPVEINKAIAGVSSTEFKRGKNSGLWHPHSHEVWICHQEPCQKRLSQEWHAITGDSYIVDVRPIDTKKDLVKSISEVFKYALKFSDMPYEDNYHAYKVLKGKRLLNPFGLLYGLKIPENLEDDPIADEPYIQYFYNWYKGSGYNLSKTEHYELTETINPLTGEITQDYRKKD